MGVTGPTGTLPALGFADFFALMPPDNAATVAPGTAVAFPRDGSSSGSIVRTGPGTFSLPPGAYLVLVQVSVGEAGQLVLALNPGTGFLEDPTTVVGRATGTSQIVGMSILTAAAATLLEVRNPAANATALTVTPLAGGADPVSAHLVIQRLA